MKHNNGSPDNDWAHVRRWCVALGLYLCNDVITLHVQGKRTALEHLVTDNKDDLSTLSVNVDGIIYSLGC